MGKWVYAFFLIGLVSACSSGNSKKVRKSDSDQIQPLAGNAEVGRTLYDNVCKNCHGQNGEGNIKFKAPALANTDMPYLYRQMMNYRKGLRGYLDQDTSGLQMAAMAKALKDSTAVLDVLSYIKIMPGVSIVEAATGDKKKGENIYQSVCGSCHGPNASGNEKLNAPQLSNLDAWYLKQQITKFKKSIRGAHPDDKLGAQMISMMTLLPDDQSVNDVIAYMHTASKPVSK
jgi:cbb3-type cytochrome c oxidase subunit III